MATGTGWVVPREQLEDGTGTDLALLGCMDSLFYPSWGGRLHVERLPRPKHILLALQDLMQAPARTLQANPAPAGGRGRGGSSPILTPTPKRTERLLACTVQQMACLGLEVRHPTQTGTGWSGAHPASTERKPVPE